MNLLIKKATPLRHACRRVAVAVENKSDYFPINLSPINICCLALSASQSAAGKPKSKMVSLMNSF